MDGHTVVTVCLGGSHLDSHPNPCNISSEPMPMICSPTTCRRKHNSHNISCRFTLPHAVEPSETNTTVSRGGGGGGGGGQRNFLQKEGGRGVQHLLVAICMLQAPSSTLTALGMLQPMQGFRVSTDGSSGSSLGLGI